MAREIWNLNNSFRQINPTSSLGNIPIINLKATYFFKRSIFNFFLPLNSVDRLREKIHQQLLKLSQNCRQIQANNSSHFIWIDEPELIPKAIELLLKTTSDFKK